MRILKVRVQNINAFKLFYLTIPIIINVSECNLYFFAIDI